MVMRARVAVGGLLFLSLMLAVAGCRPSATVQSTTPVANLQPYRLLLVRGTGAADFRRGRLAVHLQRAVSDAARVHCGFSDVRVGHRANDRSADLILDLTLMRAFRGGSGLVQNENLATVDVKLVLSDGIDQELIGSADIRGKSSGIVIGNESPERQAIGAVADQIAGILVRSGCAGPRIARARPERRLPSADTIADTGEPAQGDQGGANDTATRAEAENDEGKRLFRAADVSAAKTHFETAISLHRDPRYVFNLCLAEEALGSFDAAVSACQRVLHMKPDKQLSEKAKLRLKLIEEKRHSQTSAARDGGGPAQPARVARATSAAPGEPARRSTLTQVR